MPSIPSLQKQKNPDNEVVALRRSSRLSKKQCPETNKNSQGSTASCVFVSFSQLKIVFCFFVAPKNVGVDDNATQSDLQFDFSSKESRFTAL